MHSKKSLLFFALILWCVFYASRSWATSVFPTNNYGYCSSWPGYSCPSTSQQPMSFWQSQCAALAATYTTFNIQLYQNASNAFICGQTPATQYTYKYWSIQIVGAPVCPTGTSYNSSTSMCDQTCPSSGSNDSNFSKLVGYPDSGGGICINGCSYSGSNSVCMNGSCVSGVGAATGSTCTGSTLWIQDTPQSCSNQGMGYISDGVTTKCVPNGASSVPGSSASGSVPAPTIGSGNNQVPGSQQGCGGCSANTPAASGTPGLYDPSYNASGVQTGTQANPVADFCKANPTSSMCVKQICDPIANPAGCLGAAPAPDTIPTVNPTFYDPSVNTVPFAQSNSCPAEQDYPFVVGGHSFMFRVDWQPWCNFASSVKPLFLALAAITAAFIFAAGLTL